MEEELKKKRKRYPKIKSGDRFGKLVVIEPTDERLYRNIKYLCKCDCGNFTKVTGHSLNCGDTKSCGCLSHQLKYNLTGQIFGLLTVVKYLGNQYWECICECGKISKVRRDHLINGDTISCGCHKKSKNEILIAKMLDELGMKYETEVQFVDCLLSSGYLAKFDFYVEDKYIIEYDGQQHFIGTELYPYEKTHLYDLQKNQYCFKNNIPLIRIPYYSKYTIQDLKLDTTSFLFSKENEEQYYNQYGGKIL